MENTEHIDYLHEGFKIPIQQDGVRTYASINAQMGYDEEGPAPTGDFFIYLLHPKYGSCYFLMELDENDNWKPVNAPAWVENSLFLKISDAICCRKF